MGKYINPFTDFGFKKLFGEEANADLLIDFLNTLLEGQKKGNITTITYLKNEHLGKQESDRKAIFDLYCETDTGERFIVEMQKARQKFFKDRTLYYATFPIQAQAKRNKKSQSETENDFVWDYQLQGVYCISVMDFEFDDSPIDKIKHDIMLMDITDKTVFYNKMRFIYLEMPHFTKNIDELETHYDKWLFLLKNLPLLEEIPEKLTQKIFMKVFETADTTQYEPHLLAQYQDSLKQYRDLKNSLDTAFEDGETNKAKSVAKNAIQEGLSDHTITKLTGLSLQDIAQIRKDIEQK